MIAKNLLSHFTSMNTGLVDFSLNWWIFKTTEVIQPSLGSKSICDFMIIITIYAEKRNVYIEYEFVRELKMLIIYGINCRFFYSSEKYKTTRF